FLGLGAGRNAATGFARDFDVGDEIECGRQRLAERRVVVDDEHAHRCFLSVREVHGGRGGPPSRQWLRRLVDRTCQVASGPAAPHDPSGGNRDGPYGAPRPARVHVSVCRDRTNGTHPYPSTCRREHRVAVRITRSVPSERKATGILGAEALGTTRRPTYLGGRTQRLRSPRAGERNG